MSIDLNNLQGSLGEVSVTKEMYKQGYIVYTQYSGFSPFDLVAYNPKTHELYRVSVKSSINRRGTNWIVDIRQKMYSGGQYFKVPFNNKSCDIVAVYLPSEDRVVTFDSSTIINKRQLSIPVLA